MTQDTNTSVFAGRIVRLAINNFMKLSAFDITPKGNLVVIGGDNGAGKTSAIKAIACLFGGATEFPEVPVREGEEKATILADLGDMIVTRTITATGGGSLKITNKEGFTSPSPQKMLEKLLGKLTFDPLAFYRLEAKDQLEALRKLVGLDFTTHDAERQRIYDQRTILNADVKRCQVQAEPMPHFPEAPAEEQSFAELNDELEKARATNRENEKARENIVKLEENVAEGLKLVEEMDAEIARIEDEIAKLQAKLAEVCDQRHTIANRVQESMTVLHVAKETVANLADVDVAPIRQRIAAIETTNRQVRANVMRADALKTTAEKKARADAMTQQIEALDEKKAKVLAETPFPVEGLGFGDKGVTFGGLPLSQASGAQQLRVSIAIGAALNPKLRVMLVRDASLLDDKSFALLGEEAKARQLQVFLEQVGHGSRVQVVIEDGHVAEIREPVES